MQRALQFQWILADNDPAWPDIRTQAELHSKKAIRRWIEGNMTRQKSIWNRIRERVLNTIRRIARMAH